MHAPLDNTSDRGLHYAPFFWKALAILYQHKSSNFILFPVFAVYLVIIDLLYTPLVLS